MLGKYEATNTTDENGNPTGGTVEGVGLKISWQDGPLGRGDDRTEPNGAFVETVIDSARQRIAFYQTAHGGKFNCPENEEAIFHLVNALRCLNERTRARKTRQVEGTHVA